MHQHPWEIQRTPNSGGTSRFTSRPVVLVGACLVIASLFVLHGWQRSRRAGPPPTLSANLKQPPTTSTLSQPTAFGDAIVAHILEQGHLTVTVHVALMGGTGTGQDNSFSDGTAPGQNLYWGALFGLETHFANAAAWRRAHTDSGDGGRILRRVIFHKKVERTQLWTERGVNEDFDLYGLACAWSHNWIKAAMEQPLRDAMCGTPTPITVDGTSLLFGGGSSMSGYVGQNAMLDSYWNPFEDLTDCDPAVQTGVFYACPRSAVVLHRPILDQGLYSVLFTRTSVIPEAYLIDGLLHGLLSGQLDAGFVKGAAKAYAHYQKSVPLERAMSFFLR